MSEPSIERTVNDRGFTVRNALDPALSPTYEAARRWVDTCLRGGGSLFGAPVAVWINEPAADLKKRFVESSLEGDLSFTDKLTQQLEGASQETYLLVAEMLYIHLLPLSSVGAGRKAELINLIGSLAPEPFAIPNELEEALALGLANGGVGFNTNRFYLVSLLIEFACEWTSLDKETTERLLNDPWAFKQFLADLPQQRSAAQRNALLFLIFPDTFEDITSTEHKRRIINAHTDLAGPDPDIDKSLLQIRERLAGTYGSNFSWYDETVRATWDVTTKRQHTGERPLDVGQHLGSFLDEGAIARIASTMAHAIEVAHETNPASWSISHLRHGIALNIGPNRAIGAMSNGSNAVVGVPRTEIEERLARRGLSAARISEFKFPDGATSADVSRPSDLAELLQEFESEVVDVTARTAVRDCPYGKFFSEEAASFIEAAAGRELPRPAVSQEVPQNSRSAWIVRMTIDGKSAVARALDAGEVRLFYNVDTTAGTSLEDLRAAFAATHPEASPHEAGVHAGNLFRFLTRMSSGDIVLVPDGSDLYLGVVATDALCDAETGHWFRSVEFANADTPIDRGEVSPELYSKLRSLLTVTNIDVAIDELERLISDATGDAEATPVEDGGLSLLRVDDELARDLLLPADWLQDVVDMLEERGQLIFYGPPGTGKTYIAERLAQFLSPSGNYQVVQFHPSYSYEDFVEGFRPRLNSREELVYELLPGPLKSLADAARQNPHEPYFLIIDEINRGNIAKIFGELYYLLEYRESSLVLQYGSAESDEFSLPKNLFVIGTMNTADRSIAMVDAAIRRRFWFVEFAPTQPPISGLLRAWLKDEKRTDDLPARLLDELNKRLDDSDASIGPSYLMNAQSATREGLHRIWKHAILPLLVEHFYGRPEMVERFTLERLVTAIEPPDREVGPGSTPGEADDGQTDASGR